MSCKEIIWIVVDGVISLGWPVAEDAKSGFCGHSADAEEMAKIGLRRYAWNLCKCLWKQKRVLIWCLGGIPRAHVFDQQFIWAEYGFQAENVDRERNSQLICFAPSQLISEYERVRNVDGYVQWTGMSVGLYRWSWGKIWRTSGIGKNPAVSTIGDMYPKCREQMQRLRKLEVSGKRLTGGVGSFDQYGDMGMGSWSTMEGSD